MSYNAAMVASVRITNLHLIVSFLMLSGAGIFLYQAYGRSRPPALLSPRETPLEEVPVSEAPAASAPAGSAAERPVPVAEEASRPAAAVPQAERSSPAEAAPAEAPVRRVDSYVVQRGDNLWTIAKKKEVYGRGAGWVKIWRANEKRIPDFDKLDSGLTLLIPAE